MENSRFVEITVILAIASILIIGIFLHDSVQAIKAEKEANNTSITILEHNSTKTYYTKDRTVSVHLGGACISFLETKTKTKVHHCGQFTVEKYK